DPNRLVLARKRLAEEIVEARGGQDRESKSLRIPRGSEQLLRFRDVLRVVLRELGVVDVTALQRHLVGDERVLPKERLRDRWTIEGEIQCLPYAYISKRRGHLSGSVKEEERLRCNRPVVGRKASVCRSVSCRRIAVGDIDLPTLQRL